MSRHKLLQLGVTLCRPRYARQLRQHRYYQVPLSNRVHLELAGQWLLNAQSEQDDDGFSRKYNLLTSRWDNSYPETTGYIIPTMLRLAEHLQLDLYRESAHKAGQWLLSIQCANGAFLDTSGRHALVFDTGQCLSGLTALYRKTADVRYQDAASRAASWLCERQETDGQWIKGAYLSTPHTYYALVAAHLIEWGELVGDSASVEAGKLHLRWVQSKQLSNGFITDAGFTKDAVPYLHTVMYIAEGFLKAFRILQEDWLSEVAKQLCEPFKNINLTRDFILFSQYDENFHSPNTQKCIAGLCQWASCCLELYQLTADQAYLALARRTLFFLKSKQSRNADALRGGFPGSLPYWGKYCPGALPNWNNKYFIDALLKLDTAPEEAVDATTAWINESFSFNSQIVDPQMTKTNWKFVQTIQKALQPFVESGCRLLEVGCGSGKLLKAIQSVMPEIQVKGIEPQATKPSALIIPGDVYQLDQIEETYDVVLCVEVFQHIADWPAALASIKRRLSPGGRLLIIDRDPYSLLGLAKPLLEKRGRWMYIPESPFRERWLTKKQWAKCLQQNGFTVVQSESLRGQDNKLPWQNRYRLFVAKKVD